ncbi:MAG: 16S rRNA (adenine(1518)-N(6)/adenine(1519)-N(6))-dimethyltransferase RsmA [Elusimicrobiota bacterium]|nr:MAG: 16S rRNA (adenine(1518)-N(6)/adenine(1519)-N(6))-dimethyltransferase RsmA [Elusimicrobiota bacterium]
MGARLGQHFLRDEGARDAIAELSGAGPGVAVLEIGPGRAALTGRLLATGADVTAIELDENLAAKLPAAVGGDVSRLTIVNEDFLRLDLRTLGPGPWRIVANLPYAVGTPILQRILEWDAWDQAVLMFQKEVADRITASPGGADYGLLALSVLARADAAAAFDIPPSAFTPPPAVDSAVVVVTRRAEPRLPAAEEKAFWRLAKIAFAQRRKMAAGVLSKALGKTKAETEAAFAAAGLDASVRPERIPFEAWRALARALT